MIGALKGRFQFYLFLLGYHRMYLISALVTAAGVVGAILGWRVPDLRSAAAPSWVLGLVSTVAGVGLFIKDAWGIRQVQRDLYTVRKRIISTEAPSGLRLSDTYAGYRTLAFRDHTAIYSPAVNGLLRDHPIKYKFDAHYFRMKPAARLVAPVALKKAFATSAYIFNSPKVRLRYDPTEQAIMSGKVAELQETDYFTELCTNAMVDWQVLSKADNSLRFDGLDLMANNGTILDLEDAECGCCNLIGVSTIAFTRDGYLIIPIQGDHTQKNSGYLAPSGSGSADLADLDGTSGSLPEFIRRATERELREECGISDSKCTIRTELIGFCRVLDRGGLPEFFSVSFIDADHADLHVPEPEFPYIAHIDRRRISRESVSMVLDEVRRYRTGSQVHSFSLQLYLNLMFLEDYLASAPVAFADLLASPTRPSEP